MLKLIGTWVKMMFYVLILIAILIGGAFMFGPRTPVDTSVTFDPAAMGEDLDGYLKAEESKVADVKPGQQKQIVWAYPGSKARTPIAIIYIHGFSASPQEIRPVPEMVAKALGANLFFTRLNGHGETNPYAMGTASVHDWVNDLAEAIAIGRKLGEKIVIISTSTGGSLTTWALTEPDFSNHVAAAIFISPNYGVQATGAFLLTMPFAKKMAHLVLGETRSFDPVNDKHAQFWTSRYPVDALLPMAETVKLAVNAPVSTVAVPALFFISPKDQVVRPELTRKVAAQWGAPHKLIEVQHVDDPYAHVLAGDILSPSTTSAVAQEMIDWLKSTLPPSQQ